MELPEDPMMLFIDKEMLVAKLKAAGFEYSREYNKFW